MITIKRGAKICSCIYAISHFSIKAETVSNCNIKKQTVLFWVRFIHFCPVTVFFFLLFTQHFYIFSGSIEIYWCIVAKNKQHQNINRCSRTSLDDNTISHIEFELF